MTEFFIHAFIIAFKDRLLVLMETPLLFFSLMFDICHDLIQVLIVLNRCFILRILWLNLRIRIIFILLILIKNLLFDLRWDLHMNIEVCLKTSSWRSLSNFDWGTFDDVNSQSLKGFLDGSDLFPNLFYKPFFWHFKFSFLVEILLLIPLSLL